MDFINIVNGTLKKNIDKMSQILWIFIGLKNIFIFEQTQTI